MTTGSTQVMSKNISHSLFHINTTPKYIKKISFTIVLYLHIVLLFLSSFNSNPFFNHILPFSVIPLPLLFSSFCVQISLSLCLSVYVCVCVSLSLSLSSFLLRSHTLTFFIVIPFIFYLSLSFYPSLPVL